MKIFSVLTTAMLLGVSLLGGCHGEIRNHEPLAQACAYDQGYFECQVQTVIRGLYNAYTEVGWHNPKPTKFTPSTGIQTGILVNYRCGVPHSVETPHGIFLLNVGEVTLADYTVQPARYVDTSKLFQLMPKGVDMKLLRHDPIAGAIYSPTNATVCDRYGMDYYGVETVNGYSVPSVTYLPTPPPPISE